MIQKEKSICNKIQESYKYLDQFVEEDLRLMFHDICQQQIKIESENEKLIHEKNELALKLAKYIVFYDQYPIGICITNDHGAIIKINSFADKLFANKCGLTHSKKIDQFIYKDDQNLLQQHYQKVLLSDTPQSCTLRLARENGEVFWVYLTTTVRRTLNSYEYWLTITDIDAVKQAEEQLQKNLNSNLALLKMQKLVLDALPVRLFWKDLNSAYLGCNKAFAQYAGYASPEDLIGLDDLRLGWAAHAEEMRRDDYEVMSTARAKLHCEETTTSSSGRQTSVTTSKVPLKDEQERVIGVLGYSEDIAHRKPDEGARLGTNCLKPLSSTATSSMHDFNNILMEIMGNVAIAKNMLSPSDAAFERLEQAETSALKAEELTRKFIVFPQDSFSGKKQVATLIFLHACTRRTLGETQCCCSYIFRNYLWDIFIDEEEHVGRALDSILLNASQAMDGKGRIRIQAENVVIDDETPPLENGSYVKVTLTDHGRAIPKEYLDEVFDPYFSPQKTDRGLGLAVAYSILQKNKGHLTVESSEGKGATFTLYLPALHSNPSVVPEEEIVERLQEGRVLVMDDDQTVCNLLSIMLEQLGYAAETANNGEEVLEKYTEAQRTGNPFDVVIMDLIVTTGMGGRDTMEELKKIDPYARAIISSGYVHNSILSDYRCYGFQAVLPKPYRLSDLKNALMCVLRDQSIEVQQDVPLAQIDDSPPLGTGSFFRG